MTAYDTTADMPETEHPVTRMGWDGLGPAARAGDQGLLVAVLDGIGLGLRATHDALLDPSVLLDPAACPPPLLPWSAQWSGTQLDLAQPVAAQRQRILNRPGWTRGTQPHLVAVVREIVGPTARIDLTAPDAVHLVLHLYTTQVPPTVAQAALAALLVEAPAWMGVTLTVTAGASYTQTRTAVTSSGQPDTLTGRKTRFPTIADASTYVPPGGS